MESVLSFLDVARTQVVRLGGQCLNPLIHLWPLTHIALVKASQTVNVDILGTE